VPPSPPRPQQQQQTRQQQQHPAPQTTSERKVYSTQVIAQRQAQPSNQQPQQPLPQRQYQQQPVSYSRPEAMKDPERTPVPARELHPSYGQRQPSSHALELTRGAQPSASTTAVYSAQRSGQSTYSTGIKLREIRGVGLQVIRLTAGSSAMLSGQVQMMARHAGKRFQENQYRET
jgi:predicted phage tail protein